MDKIQESIDNGTLFARKLNKGANPKWRPSTTISRRKIGLDFGGVIVNGEATMEKSDTMFGENYLESPEVPGTSSAIRLIVDVYGAPNVYIVSKARQEMRRKTSEWLDHTEFCERIGLWRCNVLFCRERGHKGPIAEKLGISAFVDDKEPCLTCMPDSVSLRLLFGGEKGRTAAVPVEETKSHEYAGEIVGVADWDAVLLSLELVAGI